MLYSLKKQITGIQARNELWDMYTHILPLVDDGPISRKEACDIVVKLKKLGFQGAYCTPHISAIFPNNSKKILEEQFTEFSGYLSREKNVEDFALRLAAIYMLDDSFLATLDKEDELLTYDGKRVLVEFHQLFLKDNWKEMLSALRERNYIPVLAHPEKYINTFTPDQLDTLHEEGVEFQLNLFSLFDIYGKEVRSRAIHLLKKGHYHNFGTGCHRDSQLRKLRLVKLSKLLKQ